jgi:hypothetical protein
LRLVEVAGEADLVADLGGRGVDPGVRRVRQHLALQECFHLFLQWHLLSIAEVSVGFVFDHELLVADGVGIEAVQRIDCRLAGLVDLGNDRCGRIDAPTDGLQEDLQLRAGELEFEFL